MGSQSVWLLLEDSRGKGVVCMSRSSALLLRSASDFLPCYAVLRRRRQRRRRRRRRQRRQTRDKYLQIGLRRWRLRLRRRRRRRRRRLLLRENQ